MNKIYFHDLNSKSALLQKKEFTKFLFNVFKAEKKLIERIDIIFCTDEYLLFLNRKFLNHNFYTDTLTFPLSNSNESIIGEIYISIDRIKSNANSLNLSYQHELLRVIIHGCLHLCGHLDNTKNLKTKIGELQEQYLEKWIVSRETQIGG